MPNRSLIQGLHWYNGSIRKIFGPEPGALIPLNLMAALFVHSHSDTAMRILHGYTSLGLIPGLLVSLFLCRKNYHFRFALGLLVLNLCCLPINTWIAIEGMGIPYGRQFHLLLALLILVNFLTIDQLKQTETKVLSDQKYPTQV